MNLKGVEFINYLYIIVLSLGTWINVNVFSSIQWFGILFYIYNVFCVDERGKEYFKNLRFLIVFLMSFSNMIMIFQSYVIYEYALSANQDTYYIQLTNLGFEYTKDTNILIETGINLVLAIASFIVGLMVFMQLNRNQGIFEGRLDEQGRPSTLRVTTSSQQASSFVDVLAKYDWAQRFLTVIFGILILLTITVDGLFGVFYSGILACWLLSKLHYRHNELTKQISIDLMYLGVLKIFSLLTCYCGLIWKLNVFVRQYKGVVYMVNGYISSYTFLFAATFILELLLLMFTVYAQDLLRQLQPQHIVALKAKHLKYEAQHSSRFSDFLNSNYFGSIIIFSLIWVSLIPSLFMSIPLLILLVGSVFRKQRDIKLKSSIAISYFAYIFYFLLATFNIPFLFKYVTSSLLFNLLGLHSYNEEEKGVDGLLNRMSQLAFYQIVTSILYLITLKKVQEKVRQHQSGKQNQSRFQTMDIHQQQHQVLSQFNPQADKREETQIELQHSETSLQLEDEDDQIEEQLNESQKNNIHPNIFEKSQTGQESDSQLSLSLNHGTSFLNELKKKKESHKNKFVLVLEDLAKGCLLHLDKGIVCLIFAASIYRIDIIHALFMVAFLLFVFLHMKYWRTLMKVIIAYSFVVIIFHYIVSVLYENGTISITHTLVIIGFKENPKMKTFLSKQIFEILIILFSTYCQANIVYISETYRRHQESYEELENISTSVDRKQQLISQLDFVSRFFIDNGVWVCYVSLLSVGLLPPANILSLGYLIFLQIFISFTMIENEEKTAFKKIMKGWPLLVFICSFILIVRYSSLFIVVSKLIHYLLPSKTLVEDMGLSHDLNTLQICGNAIILLVLNAQRRLVDAKIYESRATHVAEQIPTRFHKTVSYFFYQLKIRILLLLSVHFSKIVLFYGLIVSILHQSAAGQIACFIQMLVFLLNRDSYWKRVWIPLWMISFTFLLLQYLFQLHVVGDNLSDEEKAWAGLFSITTNKYWIFLGLYILQQILCVIMRKLQKYETQLQDLEFEQFKKDYQDINQKYKIIEEKIQIFYEEQKAEKKERKLKEKKQKEEERQKQNNKNKSSNTKDLILETAEVGEQDIDQSNKKKTFEDILSNEEKQTYQQYLKWIPFLDAENSEISVKEFFKYVGYDLSIFVIIVAAYFEMNAISLVHIFLASFFALFSDVVNSTRHYSPRLIRFVNLVWRTINYLIFIDITRKYFLSIWFPEQWHIFKPWDSWSFTCNSKGKKSYADEAHEGFSDFQKCTKDWKYWLSLENESNLNLIFDVINFQIMVIYDRYFGEILLQGGPKRAHENIASGDALDFTRNSKTLLSYLKVFIFGYFYQIAIMIFFVIGSLNTISSYTDLISIAYLFTSIYMLFSTKVLLRVKNDMWKYLLSFNTSVMCVLCMYQSPIFQCPILYPENRYYLTSEECLALQTGNEGDLYILNALKREVDSTEDLYILLSHMLGFNKLLSFGLSLSKESFMILFCLFGLLQKNIWNHPYTQHYLEPYFKDQRELQKQNAVSSVAQIHLKRVNAFQQQKMELEVYNSIQQRVEGKVFQWDNLSKKQNKSIVYKPEESLSLLANIPSSPDNKDNYEEQQIQEEIISKAERIVLESDVPIHLQEAIEACQKYHNDPEGLQKQQEKLRQKGVEAAIEEVFDNPIIGISEFKESISWLNPQNQYGDINQQTVKKRQINDEGSQSENNQDEIPETAEKKKNIEQPEEESFKPTQKQQQAKSKGLKSKIKLALIEFILSMLVEADPGQIDLCKKEESLQLACFAFFQNKFHLVCLLAFILNAVMNGDLLSLFYPAIYFQYALLESPFPSRTFWKLFMFYTIGVISVKFLYQLPVFCGSPPYHFFLFAKDAQCSDVRITQEQALSRIDFLIGIKKYMGPASYPYNQGFFAGIFWDYVVLLCLFIQRYLMQLEGKWTYIFLSKDVHFIPQYRDPVQEYKKYRQLPIEEQAKNSFSLDAITDATIITEPIDDLNGENLAEEEVGHQDGNNILGEIQEENIQTPFSINAGNEHQDEEEEEEKEAVHIDHSEKQQQSQQYQDKHDYNKDDIHNIDENDKTQSYNAFELFIYRLFPFYLNDKEDSNIPAQKQSESNTSKPGKNYYIHQFVSSFLVLVFFILFFPQMTRTSSTMNSQIPRDTRFSRSIVVIIIISISVMVIDRILYKLRRVTIKSSSDQERSTQQDDQSKHAALFKLVLHVILTISLHVYLFFVLTQQTRSLFSSNIYLVICYILVSIYLYFSALQIRSGYPQMTVGSIFSRDTSLAYRLSFNIYRALPFLYELRSVIDWTFTSTSLDIFQWFKMEDAYANLYSVKAEMNTRKETHKLGEKRGFWEKCSNGFILLLLLLIVILLPIFLFSNLNPAVELNNLTSGSMNIELQIRNVTKELNLRLFEKGSLEIKELDEHQFNIFEDIFYGVDSVWSRRLQVLKIDSQSDTECVPTGNILKELKKQLTNPDANVFIHFNWIYQRPKPAGKEQVSAQNSFLLDSALVEQMSKLITDFSNDQEALTADKTYEFDLKSSIPFFQQIPDQQVAIQRGFEPVQKTELKKLNKQLPKDITENPGFDPNLFSNINAKLIVEIFQGSCLWSLQRTESPYFDEIVPYSKKDSRISIITLSEMAFSSILSSMSDNLSVIGIYLTVVLTVGRFLRLYFNQVSMRCIWEEMPNTDELFDLCQSIYIARLENDLIKEEKNYELLIRILRSPEILLRLTGKSLYHEIL